MRVKFFILVVLFFAYSYAKAQEEESSHPYSPHKVRTVIKGNPFSMLVGVIPLTSEFRLITEYAVSKNQSTQIGFSYLGKSPFLAIIESGNNINNNGFDQKLKVQGYRVQASHKFYFSQFGDNFNNSDFLAPQGFYVSPHISYSTAKIYMQYFQVYDIWIRATQFNANILIGGQLFLGKVAIDMFTGLGYKKNEWVERYSQTQITIIDPLDLGLPPTYNGSLKFSLGFNIGYGF
ncbi:MAG: hypothetical protein JKY53_07015 [Flavobacteriales bacterium]|nr:hypothetical protein [Flavobacteriales bacterium]